MIKIIIAAVLFTGCATAQLSHDKRDGMRTRLAHNTRCMDRDQCDRAVNR